MTVDHLKPHLLANVPRIVAHLLPNGRESRGEWYVGDLTGAPGKSLRVRLQGDKAGIWLDAATGESGDIIKLWQETQGVDFRTALRQAGELLNIADDEPDEQDPANNQSWQQFQRQMGTGTNHDLARLAELRQLPTVEGIERAINAGHLFFAPVFDDGQTHYSWIITDASRRAAQARRLDGQPYAKGQKSKSIHGLTARWPIGLADSQAQEFAIVEGGPDFLAAYTAIALLNITHVQPIAILGSSQRIHPDAIPQLSRASRIWVFPHNDDNYAGLKGALSWQAQLGRQLTPFDFRPYGVKDLNEFVTKACGDNTAATAPTPPPTLDTEF